MQAMNLQMELGGQRNWELVAFPHWVTLFLLLFSSFHAHAQSSFGTLTFSSELSVKTLHMEVKWQRTHYQKLLTLSLSFFFGWDVYWQGTIFCSSFTQVIGEWAIGIPLTPQMERRRLINPFLFPSHFHYFFSLFGLKWPWNLCTEHASNDPANGGWRVENSSGRK